MLIGVVDDDVRVLEALDELLAATGHEACLFETAEAFLESEVGIGTACLISDVQLPGMNGFELVSELKARNRNLPVILITGLDAPEIQRMSKEAGALAVFAKPFDPTELLTFLRLATSQHKD
ncbi:response regulator transcription factor [Granulicella sp. L60]|jgi:FixJ family two-component response regulator|uniref:response regulator transcription factor n=1 Tax=Granulicella sp. L60 TaxID=1641866 RepID=UPI00131CAD1C|nr:response regulator [Granulicella sp. L60]